MSILEQSRALPTHIPSMTPTSQPLLPPHAMVDGPPNSDVLLALLARNKALEGKYMRLHTIYRSMLFEIFCINSTE